MMRLVASSILVLAAACGSSTKPATSPDKQEVADPIPKTAGPECSVVADKLSIVVEAENPDAQASARTTIQARCSQDKWSDEARSCFATVENDDEVEGCRKQLSDAQRAKWSTGAKQASKEAAPEGPAPDAGSATKKKKTQTRSADPEEGGE